MAQAQTQLKADRTVLDGDRKKLTDDQQQTARLAQDQGFQDSLSLYNSMPPKQAKTVFLTMDDATVVNYLRAMTPRTAAKILKEFKSPEELDRVHKLMDRMRVNRPRQPPRRRNSSKCHRLRSLCLFHHLQRRHPSRMQSERRAPTQRTSPHGASARCSMTNPRQPRPRPRRRI